jgi:rhomboid family GlyGly-CTERM serine protease
MFRKLPWITLAMLALACMAQLWPELASLWQLADQSLARGELWRLFGGHLTHWSWNHLLWDGAALLFLGAALERANRRLYVLFLLIAGPVLSLGLLAVHPEMQVYRGLSGIDSALFTAWALGLLRQTKGWDEPQRWLWATALGTFFAKLAWVIGGGGARFVDPQG